MPEDVKQVGRLLRFRSVVAVPMLRESEAGRRATGGTARARLIFRRRGRAFEDIQ